MKRFLRRLFRPAKDWDQNPEIAAFAQLVETAEPDPDLLTRIEAQIDSETPVRKVGAGQWRRRAALACLLVVVAAVSGISGYLAGPDRQRIVARPAASADWVHLGDVSLHGPALRDFVREKCRSHTHFYISMYGVSVGEAGPSQETGEALAQKGEKILMECIF